MVDTLSAIPSRLWSEGPTSSALQEALDKLDERTEQVRANLYFNILRVVRQEPGDSSTLSALASLEAISSESGTEQWVAQCANKYLEMQQYVASLQAELRAAQAAADLEATLIEFRGYLENGQLSEAAFNLVQLRKVLDDSNSSNTQAYSPELNNLKQACQACATDLDEALESSFIEAFETTLEHGVITLSCALSSGGDVCDLWEAMEKADMQDKYLGVVAGTLLHSVLPGVLNGTVYLNSHISPDGSAQVVWGPAQVQVNGRFPTESVEQYCMQLLHVLAQTLFRQRPSTLAKFGRVFWGDFVALYHAAFLQQVQGSTVAVLQARQDAAKQMEQQAVATGLAAPGSDLARCLSQAIQESYYVIQEQYLAEARELLLAHDPAAEPVTVGQPLPLDTAFYQRYKQGKAQAWELLDPPSGWDVNGPVLATGHQQVSSTVLQLVMMIDDALSHACHLGDTSTAQAVVSAVAKMAAMFSAMLATPAAADAPALALQHHNDLQYLSAHLLMVPFLFGEELGQLLGSKVWLGEDALRLRGAARAALTDTLSVQAAAVRDSLAPVLELSASLAAGDPTSAREAQTIAASAHKGSLYTLRRAGKLLWGCLAPNVALEASRQLLEELGGMMVHDVLIRKDIGESEANALVVLYQPLLEASVPELLVDVDVSNQTQADMDIKELIAAALHQRCSTLRKLDAVLGLLEARLADIVGAWESGVLRSAGLCLSEVEHLVVALFEDTDYRAQCMQKMEAAELQ